MQKEHCCDRRGYAKSCVKKDSFRNRKKQESFEITPHIIEKYGILMGA